MNASTKMPVVFIGHGSPMNVISDNPYTGIWRAIGASLPRPRAILSVSAHWYTRGMTSLIDAGDQWTAPHYLVQEWQDS